MATGLDLIEHIVIVILENRSFDHMLGYLSLPGPKRMAVEGLRDDQEWLRAHANSGVAPYEFGDQEIDDPPHELATIAVQIGKPLSPGGPCPMNGFVESYRQRQPAPSDQRMVMGYYTDSSVPAFDFFARQYTICDHWFASLPTGTQPNRLMAMSGTTSILDNAPVLLPDQPLVYDWLSEKGVPWCVYQSGDFLPFFSLMPRWMDTIAGDLALDFLVSHAHPHFRRFGNFARDWKTESAMPSVIFIEPEYTDGPHSVPNDDHPPTGALEGQAFVASIYNALIANETRWKRTAMIVMYDEHGGFFDHVPPLAIPLLMPGHGPTPVLSTTGVRVPAFLISPLVEPGSVFSKNVDHTSVLQLFADKFGNGLYSPAVYDRQPGLARLSEAISRTTPRTDAPTAPSVERDEAARPTVAQRAPGANANAAAFRLAAKKIVTNHAGISVGWPALKRAADAAD